MLSWDEFNTEFKKLCAALERRRKRYLLFFFTAIAAVACALFLIFQYSASPESVKALGHGYFQSLVIFGSIAWVLLPAFYYRGVNSTAGLRPSVTKRFSLKDDIYSKLFHLFGPIEFAPRGGVSLAEVTESVILPRNRLYMPEDYITGQLNDVRIELCEAELAQVVDRKRVALFQGLLLVCDISNPHLKVRKGFSGRTIVINKERRETIIPTGKRDGMKKAALPEKYEVPLECYTSNPAEAATVLTPALLEELTAFETFLAGLTMQVEHWDNKLAYAISALYDYSADKADRVVGNTELPSEKAYREAMGTDLDLTKIDPISTNPASLNRNIEIEMYKDKFIVTLPCPHDLFEPNSLFEPALNDEDAQLTYRLMQFLQNVTLHLSKVEA